MKIMIAQRWASNRIIVSLSFAVAASTFVAMHSSAQTGVLTVAPQKVSVSQSGVAVEDAKPALSGGLEGGDVIVSWSRGSETGKVESLLDWNDLELQQIPLGAVTLQGFRGSRNKSWIIFMPPPITIRPVLAPNQDKLWQQCRELEKVGKHTRAAKGWRILIKQSGARDRPWFVSWTQYQLAQSLMGANKLDQANKALQNAVEEARLVGAMAPAYLLRDWAGVLAARGNWIESEDFYRRSLEEVRRVRSTSLAQAAILNDWGRAAHNRGDFARANDYHSQAQEIAMELARSLSNSGNLEFRRNNLAQADEYFQQALAIRRQFAPGTLELASSFSVLAGIAWQRADLDLMQRYAEQAIAVGRKTPFGSFVVAKNLHGLALIAKRHGDLQKSERYLREALSIYREWPETLELAGTLDNFASIMRARGDLNKAEESYRQALAIQEKLAPAGIDTARSLNGLSSVAWDRAHFAQAEDYLRQALVIQKKLGPETLWYAATLNNLGLTVKHRGKLDEANEYYRQALDIKERLAPNSLDVACTLQNIGVLAKDRGDFSSAQNSYYRSLAIRQKLAPKSLLVATTLNLLGAIARDRGEPGKAEEYHRQALSINQNLAPNSLSMANTLTYLGVIARDRGNFGEAEAYFRQSLAIKETFSANSVDVASSLLEMGIVAENRIDFDTAQKYDMDALDVLDRSAVEGSCTACVLNELGLVAKYKGDVTKAEDYYRRALAIAQKLAPDSLDFAMILNNLGAVAHSRGDLGKAESQYTRAAVIQRKSSAGSLEFASTLQNLGRLAEDRGELVKADDFYLQALHIREAISPSSASLAATLNALGLLRQKEGKTDDASKYFFQTLDALEAQATRLGGTERVRADFRAQYARYYRDLLNALLKRHQPDRAFHVLERARAQSFLAMLAERDLLFGSEISREVQDLRRINAAEYDRTQYRISQLNPSTDQAKIDKLLARLNELSAQREQITEQIKRASPRLAALQYPKPLDLSATRQVLDSGTALLSYSVDEDHTVLFVVQPADTEPGLSVLTIPINDKKLETYVHEFRQLIEHGHQSTDPDLVAGSRRLYDLLLKPAEPLLLNAHRLLIVPDGPLQVLPFAALLRNENQYLVEWKPLHTVLSATVYAELKKLRNSGAKRAAVELAAFGDPQTIAMHQAGLERSGDAELRFASERGFTFGPLPFSRHEVEQIAALYPNRSQTYMGVEATEERAKSLGKEVRYIHFATHGILDERFPLNSAIVLRIPERVEEGKENGLLQAWEIFEQVRLDADLVTLSACNTGMGQQLSGEGLIGLTRAFQYAGAHSVLASLWSVDDFRTMQLMKQFYSSLKAGASKDEALRQAQMDLIHTQSSSSPYYWAAFSLSGDWQ